MIDKRISFYKGLDDENREKYLNERMRSHKNDGSIFPALKGQKEVLAKIDIAPLEILGHYAGKQYKEETYHNAKNPIGESLIKVDTYSVGITPDKFISGFRFGNITTYINSCKTYNKGEKDGQGRKLPEQNVLFLQHTHNQDQVIVFIMSITDMILRLAIRCGLTMENPIGPQWTMQ